MTNTQKRFTAFALASMLFSFGVMGSVLMEHRAVADTDRFEYVAR